MEYSEPDSMLSLLIDVNRRNFQFFTRVTHGLQDRQFFLIKSKGMSRDEAGKSVVSELVKFYSDNSLLNYWKGILNFWDCANRFYSVSGNEELYIRSIHFRHFIILSNYWKEIDGDDGFERYLYGIVENDWYFDELENAILKFGNHFAQLPQYIDIADKLNSGWVSREIKRLNLKYSL